jgi:hypothetical protein
MEVPKLFQTTNHAPVSVSLVASAVASIFLGLVKSKYGIDLSGQEANVTMITGALAGYLTAKAPR